MIKHNRLSRPDPNVYYAESSTYIDAIDYIEFMSEQGWKLLVEPFVTKVERIHIQRLGEDDDYVEQPLEWGFVLHRFHDTKPRI